MIKYKKKEISKNGKKIIPNYLKEVTVFFILITVDIGFSGYSHSSLQIAYRRYAVTCGQTASRKV
jgi:hypothetical protein